MNRRRRSSPREAQSVYPPRSVTYPLGGYRSTVMTFAVRCFAKLLEQATIDNQDALTAGEWNFLAVNASGRESSIDPDVNNPGDLLAQMAERGMHHEVQLDLLAGQPRGGRAKAQELADRLRALDYVHAWAVIWCLQWRAHRLGMDEVITPEEEWWTLAHRRARLAAEVEAQQK